MKKATVTKKRKGYTFQTTLVGVDYQFTEADGEFVCAHLRVPYDLMLLSAGAHDAAMRAALGRHVEALMESRDEHGQYLAIFHRHGEPYATAPQNSATYALAIALLFVLRSHKSAVT